MDELNKRLDAAIRRRDVLSTEKHRLEAKLELAEMNLSKIEAECRSKGIDPSEIDDVIAKLTAKYTQLVVQVEDEVTAAESAIMPFLKES